MKALCENCGKPIPAKRLLAQPDATLCVPCKEALGEDYIGLRSPTVRNAMADPDHEQAGELYREVLSS